MEVFANLFIGDEHAGPGRKGLAHRSQGLVRARHVMERFQYQHQVERAFVRQRRRVANLESRTHTVCGGILPGLTHRGFVGVESDDLRVRESAGQCDGGPSGATPDVGDAHARPRQRGMDVGGSRDPARHEIGEERRAVNPGLALTKGGAKVRICHTFPRAVRRDDPLEGATDACHHLCEWSEVGGVILVCQNVRVFCREPVPAGIRRSGRCVDVQEASDGLLLQPLAGITGRNPRSLCQLGWSESAPGPQRRVEAQFFTQVDPIQLERLHRRLEQTGCERFFRGRNNLAQHWAPPQMHPMGVRSGPHNGRCWFQVPVPPFPVRGGARIRLRVFF